MIKSDIIEEAFAQIRISGVTLIPDGDDVSIGLSRLESMMAQLEAGKNLRIGYNFQEDPDPSDPAGIGLEHKDMASSNLALRILSYYGKQVPPTIATLSAASLASSISISVRNRLKDIAYPSRMPVGSGNRNYSVPKYRFFGQDTSAPSTANQIYQGETKTYKESFVDFLLLGQTITGYTITADSGLTYSNDAESDGFITYDITAGVVEDHRQVRIEVTSSDSTLSIKLIDFNVLNPETVGGN